MNLEPENPSRIEPCLLSSIPIPVSDLVTELMRLTARLDRLHPATAASLAELVRIMNCYYSNLIEGHKTRPRDIERALNEKYDRDEKRRNLQIEAKAHIRVQKAIDERHHRGEPMEPASVDFIRWLHREFYKDAPDEMLALRANSKTIMMRPGAFRQTESHDNAVGRHLPPSSHYVPAFMDYFASKYEFSNLGGSSRIIAMAASHHRLNFIHPFPDGNGRVSRLMSHAMGLEAGIGAHGMWSVSRGLARGLHDRGEYKSMMDAADEPRLHDHDGRGNLSLLKLEEFVSWFLRVCIDQVQFMTSCFDLDELLKRMERLVSSNAHLHPKSVHVIEDIWRNGDMPRRRAAAVTGLKERAARSVVAGLIAQGLVTSDTPRGNLRLHFPSTETGRLFPNLFLDNDDS